MSRRATTVRALATEADLDLDEALVMLWDAGIESVVSPDDRVPARDMARAQRALNVPTRAEETTIDYWLARSKLSREAFVAAAAEVGVAISPGKRRVPKGGVRKLRRLFGDGDSAPERVEEREAIPPLRWEAVGTLKAARYLTEDEVLAIHEALVEDFRTSADPIVPSGLRSRNLLASALSRPQTGIGDDRKYPTVEMAGAALLHSLVHNHAFHNGNKRTGLVSMLVFLDKHCMVLTCSEDELFKFVLRVGQHSIVPIGADQLADREVLEIARWIRSNSRKVEQGERPLKWLRLKQRLRDFGCEWAPAGGVGNRINVTRKVQRRGFLRQRTRVLSVQVAWAGDGTEADRNTIHMIRRRLELDDDHDVDSATFYAGATIDAFIIDYRRILRRLGKF